MEELTHLTFSGNVFQKMMLVQQVSFFCFGPFMIGASRVFFGPLCLETINSFAMAELRGRQNPRSPASGVSGSSPLRSRFSRNLVSLAGHGPG